ncbi:hypothetical protein [Bacillus sp. FSL K6-3431]
MKYINEQISTSLNGTGKGGLAAIGPMLKAMIFGIAPANCE